MTHNKPQVIIDLDEYNELKNFKAANMSEVDVAELQVLRKFAHIISGITPYKTLEHISGLMKTEYGIDFMLVAPIITGESTTRVVFSKTKLSN